MIHYPAFDPIAFQIGPFFGYGPLLIHWYGIMYLVGFAAGWWLGRRRAAQPGSTWKAQDVDDVIFFAMLGVILGGRIGYVLFYAFGDFLRDPLMLVRVWDGGMSFHGGLLGVLAAAWLWSRRQKLHFFDVMDFVAPWVPPGLGFGRIGNYIGAELWGKYTHAGWGVVFPTDPQFSGWTAQQLQAQFASGALDRFARHPSQLYQACLEGLVMFVVLWWYSSKPRPRYAVSGLFALLYGVFRFLVEFVRVPDAQMGEGCYLAFGWLTMGQVLSLPLVALGLFLLWKSRSSPTLRPAVAGGRA